MKHFFIRTSSPLYHSFIRGWLGPRSKLSPLQNDQTTYNICYIYIKRERKKFKQGQGEGVWGHEISWATEEISCWNSRRQLKKKCNIQGWSKRIMQFYRISKSKALFCPEFPRVKVEFLGVIKKKSCCTFMSLGFWPWNFQGV